MAFLDLPKLRTITRPIANNRMVKYLERVAGTKILFHTNLSLFTHVHSHHSSLFMNSAFCCSRPHVYAGGQKTRLPPGEDLAVRDVHRSLTSFARLTVRPCLQATRLSGWPENKIKDALLKNTVFPSYTHYSISFAVCIVH